MPLIEILCLAVGFTGGVTLLWLAGLVRAALTRQPALQAHFTGIADFLTRSIAAANREILVLADGIESPAILQALLDAKNRKVEVEAVFGPSSQPGTLQAHVASRPVAANAVLIDGRTLLLASEPFGDGGTLVEAKDHSAFLLSFREAILSAKTPDPTPSVKPEPRPVPVFAPMPAPQEPFSYSYDPPAPTPADEVFAAVAKPAPPPLVDDEEDAPTGAAPVTLAAAELFARLRKEVAAARAEEGA